MCRYLVILLHSWVQDFWRVRSLVLEGFESIWSSRNYIHFYPESTWNMLIFKRECKYVLCSMQKKMSKKIFEKRIKVYYYFRMKKIISDQVYRIDSTLYHSEEENKFSQKKLASRMFSNICMTGKYSSWNSKSKTVNFKDV